MTATARRTDWSERDLALILTGLLAGSCADELRKADVGDIRTATGGGAVILVRGKRSKDRTVPIEADLLGVIEDYLDSRAHRFPTTTKTLTAHGLSRWPANAPLFVGGDGERITRGTIQSRVRRAFRRAGPDAQPVRGALVHGAAPHLGAARLIERFLPPGCLQALIPQTRLARIPSFPCRVNDPG